MSIQSSLPSFLEAKSPPPLLTRAHSLGVGDALLLERSLPLLHCPNPPLKTGVWLKALLVAVLPASIHNRWGGGGGTAVAVWVSVATMSGRRCRLRAAPLLLLRSRPASYPRSSSPHFLL